MILWYVTLAGSGNCGIKAADTKAEARKRALANYTPKERKEYHLKVESVRRATQQDVDHVRIMGGRIPRGRIEA